MKTLITGSAALIFLSISFSTVADITENLSETYTVEKGHHLSLSNINGGVKIVSWEQDKVEINATITADDQDARDRIQVEIAQNKHSVDIETRYKNDSNWSRQRGSVKVEYDIKVPAYLNLEDIELVNGRLEITGITGDVEAELVNGRFNADNVGGSMQVSSVNGRIDVAYAETVTEVKRISLESVNGRVNLSLPSAFNADINASTVHGGIRSDFNLNVEKNRTVGSSMEGQIGTGSTRVELETVNGGISLEKR